MASERRASSVSKDSTSGVEPNKKVYSGLKYAVSWIGYVLIGSWIFLVLEESTREVVVEHKKWARYKELLTFGKVVDELHELRKHLRILCPHQILETPIDEFELDPGLVTNETLSEEDSAFPKNLTNEWWFSEVEEVCASSLLIKEQITSQPKWSMVDAIYYTMTLVTTIGFGHISPTTDMGKLFCIPYALVGVPLTCILMAKTSDLLSNRMLTFYETTKKRYRKHPKVLLAIVTWMFLIVGCLVFMFIPSVVFAILESWTYIDAIYFTFITLSTIGFGDYIAGYGNDTLTHSDLYKILIVVWIMIALGYWIFLLNFLQKAIKSNAKTLRKTFRSKTISRQAEFLKHFIARVTQADESEEDDDYDKRLHMMALIVESLSESTPNLKTAKSYNSIHSNRTGISKSSAGKSAKHHDYTGQDRLEKMTKLVEAVSYRKSSRAFDFGSVASEPQMLAPEPSDEAMMPEIKEEDWEEAKSRHAITFQDLMKLKVSVKTDMLPGFENLVQCSEIQGWVMSNVEDNKGAGPHQSFVKKMKEVTLPMRDILSIVLLVASFDQGVQKIIEDVDTFSEEGESGAAVQTSTDIRESVPFLRKMLLGDFMMNIPLSVQDKDNFQKKDFTNYLEDCNTHIGHGIKPPNTDEDERLLKSKKPFIV